MSAENGKAVIHCCIEREIYQRLLEHCERTGQTKTMAVRRAILAYCTDQRQLEEAEREGQ